QEDVAGAPPRDDTPEQVAGDLVGRQPPLPAVGARDSVLGFQAEDAPVHERTLAVAACRWPLSVLAFQTARDRGNRLLPTGGAQPCTGAGPSIAPSSSSARKASTTTGSN